MENQREEIPENADILLFAEDLVSFVMAELFDTLYEGTRATPYREFIHNAFNETVKTAVKYYAPQLCIAFNDNPHMECLSDPSESLFLKSIAILPVHRASEGFAVEENLFYCAAVACLAGIFREKGLQEAPHIAVSRIFEYLRDYDMISAGWDSLNTTASVIPLVYEYASPPFTTATDNIGVGHRHLSNSSSDGMNLAPPDNTHYAAAAEEKKDEDKIPADDCADTFALHKIMDAENLHSTCLSSSKEHLQPSDVLEAVMENKIKYENEIQDETEMHDADLIGTLNNNENMEAENRQLPSMCERLQDLKICEVDTASNTIRNAEVSVVEAEDTSTVDEPADSGYPPKYLEKLEQHGNVQIFDNREKCGKGKVSEDSSMLFASEDSSEASGSCQLARSASESEQQVEKTGTYGN